jgi:hypothetical protein
MQRNPVDFVEEGVDSSAAPDTPFHEKIIQVAAAGSSERSDPFAKVGKSHRNTDFSTRIVDLDGHQGLDDPFCVDPAPDLELMLV